ncbi:hypothetical protein BJ878DRAFT_201374 [Calycina marina]|uniref:Uncharacterized protein n=1 Tax=Calycina marina TaxID=1763456 RepID=A0A9P8CHZ6_9HELO|nr:hypothetical protein BJ878DRAFT_201374 [Calycina marina]
MGIPNEQVPNKRVTLGFDHKTGSFIRSPSFLLTFAVIAGIIITPPAGSDRSASRKPKVQSILHPVYVPSSVYRLLGPVTLVLFFTVFIRNLHLVCWRQMPSFHPLCQHELSLASYSRTNAAVFNSWCMHLTNHPSHCQSTGYQRPAFNPGDKGQPYTPAPLHTILPYHILYYLFLLNNISKL